MSENNNTNDILVCVCPHCKQTVRIRRPQKSGRFKFTCTSCAVPFAINFTDDTQMGKEASNVQEAKSEDSQGKVIKVHKSGDKYTTIGGLKEKRHGLFGKTIIHPLRLGTQTIGRDDRDTPSDISIKDDTISRQSLELTVTQHSDETNITYSYSLKVRRSKNPVLHNGIALCKGEEIVLHIDDVISVGKTKLTLK